MKTYRRHAWIIILIISSIITPPDVFSQVIVSIPVALLYELSVLISKIAQPKKIIINEA
jgi:sec-independent protein translocase protein TatC